MEKFYNPKAWFQIQYVFFPRFLHPTFMFATTECSVLTTPGFPQGLEIMENLKNLCMEKSWNLLDIWFII